MSGGHGAPARRGPRLVSNLAWSYAASLAQAVVSVFTLGFAVRQFGYASYGAIAYSSAFIGLLGILEAGVGLKVVQAAAAADDPRLAPQRHAEVQAASNVSLLIALAALLIGAIQVAALPWLVRGTGLSNTELRVVGGVTVIGLVWSLATLSWGAVVRGHDDYRTLAAASLVSCVLRAGVLVALAGLGVVSVAIAGVVGAVWVTVVYLYWLRRHARWFRIRPSVASGNDWRVVGGFALPYLGMTASAQFLSNFDLLYLGRAATSAVVAQFRVGSTASAQVTGPLFQAFDVAFPRLARAGAAEAEHVVRGLSQLLSLAVWTAVGVIITCRFDILDIVTGRHDDLAVTVLVLTVLVTGMNAMVHPRVTLLVARGRHGLMTRVVPVEVVLKIGLTVLLVATWGPIGAAWATVLTTLVLDFVVFPYVSRRQWQRPLLRLLISESIKPAAIGLLCGWTCGRLAQAAAPGSPTAAVVSAAVVSGAMALALAAAVAGASGRNEIRRLLLGRRAASQ